MAASFNFPDLNKIPWLPVDFKLTGKELRTKSQMVTFRSGLKLNFLDLCKGYKDATFNKKTGIILSNLQNLSTNFESNTPPSISESLTEIITPVAALTSPFNKVIEISTTLNKDKDTIPNKLQISKRASYNRSKQPINVTHKDNLKFTFVKDITPTIEAADTDLVVVETMNYSTASEDVPSKFLLTWSYDDSLTFRPQMFPESMSQKFAYALSKDGICLFKPNSNFYYMVRPVNGVFKFLPFNAGLAEPIPDDAFLKFISYTHTPLDNVGIKDSRIVKYDINKVITQHQLLPDSTYSKNPYLQNFLAMYPVENPVIDKGMAYYNVDLHGLKNYQTANYSYSFFSDFIKNYSGVHRVYETIFSGTNQQNGFDKLHLGYQAFGIEKSFKKDVESPFSFPSTASRTPLSATGLILDGATAGHHPYTADRVYFLQTNYTDKIPGIPEPPSITLANDVWLCSWLSGSNLGTKVWLDRFFNSAYYTFDQALSAQTMVYHEKLDPTKNYIYDVPSTMIFEPGAFYKYFHVGAETSKNYIPFLDGEKNSDLGSKILEITKWNSSPLNDTSAYKNKGLVYTEAELLNADYLNFDGGTHVIFPARTSLLPSTRLTTSLWIKVDDWQNIQGRQIFGNYYNSGFGLINESAMTVPLLTIVDNQKGQVYNFNYSSKITNISNIPITNLTKNLFTIRLLDFSWWIFDTGSSVGYKFDADGHILKTLSDPRLSGVTQIELGPDSILYLLNPILGQVLKFSTDGVESSFEKLKNVSRFELFSYQTINTRPTKLAIKPIYGNASVVDNGGNIWQSVGNNIYKSPYDSLLDSHGDPTLFATVGITQQITCDTSDNVWILHDTDKISKINSEGLISTIRIGKRANLEEDSCILAPERSRYLNFIKTPLKGCSATEFLDVAVLIDNRDNELIMLDQNLDMVSRLDLTLLRDLKLKTPTSVPIFLADGDFTGYQFLRKFYKNSQDLSWKFKIGYANGSSLSDAKLSIDKTTLSPGWHHFGLVFNAENGTIISYIDGIKQGQTFIPDNKQIYYTYRSSFILGADSIKNNIINNIINVDNAYKFIGNIAELRIYNKALNDGDMEQLYFSSKYSDERKDLTWNMPTGTRNYVEEIEHWFKMQLPGSKSKYFNINIHNLKASDKVKTFIEGAIRKNVSKITPAHMSLYKINWL